MLYMCLRAITLQRAVNRRNIQRGFFCPERTNFHTHGGHSAPSQYRTRLSAVVPNQRQFASQGDLTVSGDILGCPSGVGGMPPMPRRRRPGPSMSTAPDPAPRVQWQPSNASRLTQELLRKVQTDCALGPKTKRRAEAGFLTRRLNLWTTWFTGVRERKKKKSPLSFQ